MARMREECKLRAAESAMERAEAGRQGGREQMQCATEKRQQSSIERMQGDKQDVG